MYPKTYQHTVILLLAAALLLPMVAYGGSQAPVTVKNYGDSLLFIPEISAQDMILTITGPCGYELNRSLRIDKELLFKLDETTIDGLYRFEITVIPEIEGSILEILRDARKTGDNSEVDKLCREGELPGTPLTQASGFTIFRSEIVYDEAAEEGLTAGIAKITTVGSGSEAPFEKATVLTNADGVIRNSLCVGFDCPNSPSFSDTTALLMENNTRIKFDDTSAIAGFPNRDWEIQANSNASGGGNYFGVNDCGNSSQGGCAEDRLFTLEANAPTHSLYVDDGGRIGNRTATPVVDIHVKDGDTPTLRLEQDTSSGFAAQTWDVAGNETSFFIRDATNGSTLPFRIRPGASSNVLVIDSDSEVGINAGTNPDVDLHIQDTDDNAEIQLETSSQSWKWRANTANNQMNVIDNTNSKTPFRIGANSDNNLFQIGVSGTDQVDVNGDLNVSGTCTGCDAVFSPEWPLESIEEHAEAMWRDSHLPAVGPTNEGGTSINVFEKVTAILQELEKAHIYIEQLHQRLEVLEKQPQIPSQDN